MSSNLRYPTDQIVGVVPDRADLDGVLTSLRDAGVDAARIHVLRGPDEGDDLAPDPGEVDGPIASMVQVVQKALGDEAARLEQLEEALANGHDVVAVELSTDDDTEDDQKRDIGAVLRRAGARDVAFYGEFQIEQLDASGTT